MMKIIKAKISDSKNIRALEQKVWKEKDVAGKYDLVVDIRFEYCFIAKEKHKLIGAILAIKTKNNKIYVQDWFVDKEYRNRGIGKKLYFRLFKATKGFSILTFIHPNFKESLEVHKKLGFKLLKKVKDVYGLKDNEYRFLMKKKN